MQLPITIFFILFLSFPIFLLLKSIWLLSSKERQERFLKESKKGKNWVELYGYEKALQQMRITLPIGIIFIIFFIGAGIAMYNFISINILSKLV